MEPTNIDERFIGRKEGLDSHGNAGLRLNDPRGRAKQSQAASAFVEAKNNDKNKLDHLSGFSPHLSDQAHSPYGHTPPCVNQGRS